MFGALKRMVMAAIDPHYENKARELANLRAAAQQNGNCVDANSRRRILAGDVSFVGFDFYCCQQYKLLDINLWLRNHQCPQCKASISVLEACGITRRTPPEQWPGKFSALPVIQRAEQPQNKSPRGMVNTWAVDASEVGYEMADPYSFSKQR